MGKDGKINYDRHSLMSLEKLLRRFNEIETYVHQLAADLPGKYKTPLSEQI